MLAKWVNNYLHIQHMKIPLLETFDFSPFEALVREDGMALVEASLATEIKTDFGVWGHDRICLVKRGQLILDFVDGTTKLSDREILYLPAGVEHRWIAAGKKSAALFMICYDKHFFSNPPALFELLDGFGTRFPALRKFSPDSTIRAPTIRFLFSELLKEKRSKAPDQKIVTLSLFMALATLLIRSQREIMEQVNLKPWEQSFNKSLKYLDENIQEKVRIASLAKITGLSYRRYTEIFKNQTGMTANEYIRKKRVELAQQLLLETGNILHASLDAGFGDLAHFYRVFKQVTKVTPKQYISNHQQSKQN